jgi:pimeloyl-ACP methyl ester carboxylesterase
MIEDQSRWVEIEGGKVHYLIEGDEQGRPVVLLHGANFTAATWKQIGTMKALAQAGYLVYHDPSPTVSRSINGPGESSRLEPSAHSSDAPRTTAECTGPRIDPTSEWTPAVELQLLARRMQ